MIGYSSILLICGTLYVSCLASSSEPDCDVCRSEEFSGFGSPASKCGCCPWPCCCKCVTIPTEPQNVTCKKLLDVMWIQEASLSIGPFDWIVVKTFIGDILSFLDDVGEEQKVAMVTYATNATLQWCFDDPQTSSMENLQSAISDLEVQDYFNNVVEGMEKAIECLQFSKPEVPKFCVVFTSRKVTHRLAELQEIAGKLHDACDEVAVIGATTSVDMDQLMVLAGGKRDMLFDFGSLAIVDVMSSVKKEVCESPDVTPEEKCFCCCTPEQFFGGGGAYYYNH